VALGALAVVFVLAALLGVPMGLAMLAAGFAYLLSSGQDVGLVVDQTMNGLYNNYLLLAVPLFIFVANVMNASGVLERLLDFAQGTVGRFRGGLAHVNILANLIFSGMSGSAVADAAGKANLEELGYALRWDNGELWTRRDEDVLCFVDAGVRCGIMPQLERDLKVERKQAKREMAAAEAAGDEAAYAFYNNKQASIKVRCYAPPHRQRRRRRRAALAVLVA
jgi:hypothetical protein